MERQKSAPFKFRRCRSKGKKFDVIHFDAQPANFWRQNIESGLHLDEEESIDAPEVLPISPAAEEKLLSGPGTGTVVAVLDSGIQRSHHAFSYGPVNFVNKVLLCKNFIDSSDDYCQDNFGCGTECAGLACGLAFSGVDEDGEPLPGNVRFRSPAPGAKLVVCKVRNGDDDDEENVMEAVTEALEFIVEYNRKESDSSNKVDVISLPLGFDSFNKKLAMAVQKTITGNIILVCSASNDNADFSNPISYPGRLGHVLCIGSCDDSGQPSKFSSMGREVDFLELGENIWAPTISDFRENEVAVLNGTSYSTSHVAGLICILLQDLKRLSTGRNKLLYEDMHNVWCMRELLKTMSVMQGHHDSAKGYGKLNPREYFKKGDEERIRICKEILGKN